MMNTYKSIKQIFLAVLAMFTVASCVHDDDYDAPETICSTGLTSNTTIQELKSLYAGMPIEITEDLVVEGFVSSSDESGNIYKTLYIQNALENPTQGLTISLDKGNTYAMYPLGSKVYVNLKGLYLGEYGGVVQLGSLSQTDDQGNPRFGRIPASEVESRISKACNEGGTITPLTVSLNSLNDNLIGTLIKIEDVQVDDKFLCETCALDERTLNVDLKSCSGAGILLRNSGYASFADEFLPTGKGSVVAVLSKFGSDYQLYINSINDMDMEGARCNGENVSCTSPADNASIADIKALYNGGLTQITDELNIEVVVTANDVAGNLYKTIYVQDETGGLKVRINKRNLSLALKYQVGRTIVISAKDLYVDAYAGEIQLGGLYNGNIGNIDASKVYKHIFYVDRDKVAVSPTNIPVTGVSQDLIGRLVRFDNVQFAEEELGAVFAPGGNTNRTFQDCDGNSLIIRTSSYADFAARELPTGKGSLTGILSVYNDTYQLWLRSIEDVNFQDARCDGSVVTISTVLNEDFSNGFDNWNIVDVTGAQTWEIVNYGNPEPSAKITGYNNGAQENEDWLISNAIAVPAGNSATLSFDNVKRYNGPDIEVYYTTDYTGDVSTTSWTQLSPALDTDTGNWNSWTSSGDLDVSSALEGNLYVAFKYVSSTSGAATFEIDNVKVVVN